MALSTILADWKILNFPDRLRDLRANVLPDPLLVQVDLTEVCNLSCSFCAISKRGRKSIPFEDVVYLIELCRRWDAALELTGGGEPLLHPQFNRIAEKILESELEFGVVTNGTKLKDYYKLLRHATWVRISLDAASSETFHRIKGRDYWTFFEILEGIKQLRDIGGPTVGVSFVISPLNESEIEAAVQLAESLGCHYIRFTSDVTTWYLSEQARGNLQIAKMYDRPEFKVFIRIFQSSPRASVQRCYLHLLKLTLGVDSQFYPCCVTKYSSLWKICSLRSNELNKLRKTMFETLIPQNCPYCPFNAKNKLLEYLVLKGRTPHAKFI